MLAFFKHVIRAIHTQLRMLIAVILTWIGIAVMPCNSAFALTRIHVDRTSGSATPPNNGDGWGSDAYKFLQDALARAKFVIENELDNDVQVWVAAGTYKPDESAANPNGSGSRNASFHMHDDVAIYAGFAGNEPGTPTGFRSRDHLTNVCILSGDIGNANDDSDNTYHILIADGVGATAIIDGFVIRDANAIGSLPYDTGLEASAGGGMLIYGPAGPRVLRCTFIDNQAYFGGAVYFFGTFLTQPQFWHCRFVGNVAIANTDPTPTGGFGGAVYSQNLGPGEGLGDEWGPRPRFVNCLFHDNSAGVSGGAAYFNLGDSPYVDSCTIANNHADAMTGGLYHDNSELCPTEAGKIWLISTILWGNTSVTSIYDEQQQIRGARQMVRCCVEDLQTTCFVAEPSIEDDPLFVNDSIGDFRLSANSPCIDEGFVAGGLGDSFDLWQMGSHNNQGLIPDLEGKYRAYQCALDMGAYEYIGCHGDIAHGDSGDAVVGGDGLIDLYDLRYIVERLSTGCGGTFCAADVTGPHCDLDEFDISFVLDSWGACASYTGEEAPYPVEVPTIGLDCFDYAFSFQCNSTWDFCFVCCLCNEGGWVATSARCAREREPSDVPEAMIASGDSGRNGTIQSLTGQCPSC